ncbi:MAG: hypothetical protein ACI9OJ_005419, partial [Myxococcota bacterium]
MRPKTGLLLETRSPDQYTAPTMVCSSHTPNVFPRALVLLVAIMAIGCSQDSEETDDPVAPAVAADPGHPGPAAVIDPTLLLRDITQWAGLAYPADGDRGLTFIDVDLDGFDDVVVPGRESTRVFRNRGDGSFYPIWVVDHPTISGIYPYTADLTGDGIDDVLLVHEEGALILRSWGNGAFAVHRDIPKTVPALTSVASLADVNGDGHMDIYLGYMSVDDPNDPLFGDGDGDCLDPEQAMGQVNEGEPSPDRLLLGPDFTDAAADVGLTAALYTQAAMFIDLDDDGALDLLIGTEGFRTDVFYRGDGNGRFVDATVGAGLTHETSAMGFDAADIDFDGDLDLYVTDEHAETGDKLYLQTSPGKFEYATKTHGLSDTLGSTGWGVGWHDLDHDADLDLFVGNGIPLGDCPGGDQFNHL